MGNLQIDTRGSQEVANRLARFNVGMSTARKQGNRRNNRQCNMCGSWTQSNKE